MDPIEIRGGLRKLEFQKPEGAGIESTHVIIEFVRMVPLPDGQAARVSLGCRDGVLREIIGLPQLAQINSEEAPRGEYLYRLRGPITRLRR